MSEASVSLLIMAVVIAMATIIGYILANIRCRRM